jgi:predicted RNase H-like nuclease
MSESVRGARCVGVDGCPGGWVAAARDGVRVFTSFAELVTQFDLIAVDMPIGMPPPAPRNAELQARRFISPRGSTIFPTPPRVCLSAHSYTDACEKSFAATGKKISRQAWNILGKIAEVDQVVSRATEQTIIEVHPECSFAMMNGGHPLLTSKQRPIGREQRVALLQTHFDHLATPPKGAKSDDTLDAYAALWTAERCLADTHRVFPTTETQRDERGLLMQIIV